MSITICKFQITYLFLIHSDKVPRPGESAADPEKDLITLMNGPVREALNISKNIKWGAQSSITFNKLETDFMKPVTHIGKFVSN